MAEVYQRIGTELTTSFVSQYTVPGATSSVVIGCRISIIGSSSGNVEIKVGASGSTKRIIGVDTPLPVGSSLSALSGDKLILEAGEIVEAKCSSANSADLIISVLEIT